MMKRFEPTCFKPLVLLASISCLAAAVFAQPPGEGRGPGGPFPRGVTPALLFQFGEIDADGDGSLAQGEIQTWLANQTGPLDGNNDNALSRDELEAAMPRGGFGPGGRPMGSGGPGGPPPMRGGRVSEADIASQSLAKTDAEKHILEVLADLNENQSRGMMNAPPEDGRLLRLLTEALGAQRVVEIGTSNGYSGVWFALALRNTGGRLTTFEIDAGRANLARENFKRAGVDGIVTLIEGDAHEEVKQLEGPIDILFLDADKEGYIDYLEKLLPLVRPGGLVAAHNMNTRQADPAFLKAITTNPDLETLFLNTHLTGISVSLKKR